ncbi:MAG: radical SAM protein [Sulfuricurvum sp.]|jgi:wyosine [tRNA(Phe)-imidazoG37] synthetase (radical SAM superfamily)|uniref:radical SAM protein n=1 Tax=Sulfuricurvum sp. TaxID=2025608 RepID=UPI0025F8DE4A|nr:radical SAM protein [Sulfuricurvum sp.]MCK9374092.1 radical SAM protein [Sulfuricurvum sp.]
MSTIFGPIHSRRFGVSLGIDLSSSAKQCNFDCLYCELAPARPLTRQHTVTPVESILQELTDALSQHPNIDVITLTANGEPTMYPHLPELIAHLNAIKGEKELLILSNSACLNDEAVFNTLLRIDQVKLSLDAATPEIFKKIDRPAEGITIEAIIENIRRFSKRFNGKLFIEILFVRGVNDTAEEVASLNKALQTIQCTRIDIGTVDRPPAYGVQGLEFNELYALSQQFDPALPIHIVSRTHASCTPSRYSRQEILSTLDKRPLTQEDINALFDDESKNLLQTLIQEDEIAPLERSNIIFYVPVKNIHRKSPKRG